MALCHWQTESVTSHLPPQVDLDFTTQAAWKGQGLSAVLSEQQDNPDSLNRPHELGTKAGRVLEESLTYIVGHKLGMQSHKVFQDVHRGVFL